MWLSGSIALLVKAHQNITLKFQNGAQNKSCEFCILNDWKNLKAKILQGA
jgi:hypothetical protein